MTNMIHLVDGEIGGVGKSMWSCLLVEYNNKYDFLYTLIDGDAGNPNVQQRYPESAKIITLAEDEENFEADIIFETALQAPVIVNLPARVSSIIDGWIETAGLLTASFKEKSGIDVCKWFLCSGRADSIEMFLESVNRFQGRLKHILVRNFGVCKDWSHLSSHKNLNKLLEEHSILVVDLPKLSALERRLLDTNKSLSLTGALSHPSFHLLNQQRMYTFLENTCDAIEATRIFNQAPYRPNLKSENRSRSVVVQDSKKQPSHEAVLDTEENQSAEAVPDSTT